ncbi:hypothetical protein PQX77_015988 [Marasmius sp. AFHP31]|nr:hypothetical protein PQX77_015988 [Marasmius sp. AFHP31]
MLTVPTADLLAYPHLFYNTEKYSFPAPLVSPDLFHCNTMFDFLVYLKSVFNIEKDNLFVFRRKEAITLGLTATQARAEDKQHVGDELTVKPIDNNGRNTNTRDSDKTSVNPDSNDLLEPMAVQRDSFDNIQETNFRSQTGTSNFNRFHSLRRGTITTIAIAWSLITIATAESPIREIGAHQTGVVSNCPPSLKQKRGKNVVVQPGSDKTIEKAVEEAEGSVAPKPKKSRGKKQVVQYNSSNQFNRCLH